MELLKLGVIGVGHMGKYHVNVASQIKQVKFVGVFDQDIKNAERIAKDYNITAFKSIDELFDQVDAVVVAVPTSKHYEVGKAVLNRGKHLLIEKPISNILPQARQLIDLACANNLKFMVGHVERYNGAVQELGNIIKHPYTWESRRVAGDSGRIIDVGVTLDLLIHDIDIALRVIKSEVMSISAQALKVISDFEDVLQCQIKFANGCLASFVVSRIHHQKERQLRITEKDCDLTLDFATQDISIYREAKTNITTGKGKISYRQQSSVERVFIHKENPLKSELEDFVKSITEDRFIDNELDYKALEISMQVIDLIKDNC